ncbi:MAG: hypothetical protein AAB048_00680 [Planctomycetota bacterium]
MTVTKTNLPDGSKRQAKIKHKARPLKKSVVPFDFSLSLACPEAERREGIGGRVVILTAQLCQT